MNIHYVSDEKGWTGEEPLSASDEEDRRVAYAELELGNALDLREAMKEW